MNRAHRREHQLRRPLPLTFIARWVVGVYVSAGAVAALLFYAGERGAAVVWPLLTIVFTIVVFVLLLRWRTGGPHLLEIGALFAGMLALYGAYPLISYGINHFEFSEPSEGRFFYFQATPSQMGSIGWWYAAFLATFCVSYLLARGRGRTLRLTILRPADGALITSVLGGVAITTAVTFAFGAVYDGHPDTYIGSYAVIQRIPLLARQILLQFTGYELTLQILLLAALFTRYRKYRLWIAVFLGSVIMMHILDPGARTQLFLLFAGAMMFFDWLVRPVRWPWILAAAIAGFLAFSALAVLRQGRPTGSEPLSLVSVGTTPTEFDSIFANAFDLKFVRGASGAFLRKPALYWADLFGFVPQQVLPVTKDTASIWYLRTYYPSMLLTGEGLAFGAVAEAVVGLGLVELLWRGALLGLCFGWVQRRLVSGPVGFVGLSFYVWLSVWSFQAIRNTTLSLITLFIYRFIAPVALVMLVAQLLRRVRPRALRARAGRPLSFSGSDGRRSLPVRPSSQ